MAHSKHPIAVIGTGTMGAGIAQVAAVRGWTVFVMDVDQARVIAAINGIRARLDRLVDKGLMTSTDRAESIGRLKIVQRETELKDCDLVIEAIVEDLGVKTMALSRVMHQMPPDGVIASNTSSLSISKLGEALGQPGRVVGMHFFNPAPLMPLVEVVAGQKSDPAALKRVTLIAEAWGKTVARCNDTPGFIVNRVARPYYLESFRILEEGLATVVEVDKAMRDLGGFKMGPFELTDLIGQDVNAATTQSLFEQLGRMSRFRPSRLQAELVKSGHLGRKSGRGCYDHQAESPVPAIQIAKRPLAMTDRLHEAVERFAVKATDQIGSPIEQYIFSRVLITVINEAAWALHDGVAAAADINTAMRLGTNYPKGPLEWAGEIGEATCGELLDALNASVTDKRFTAPQGLNAKV